MPTPVRRPRQTGATALAVLAVLGTAGGAAAQSAYSGSTPVSGGRVLPPRQHPRVIGRPGPPGTFVSDADMAPVCIAAVTRAGFPAQRVSCAQLATKPGLTTQCIISGGGRTASAIATFLDYDPATGRAATDCVLKSVIGR